MLLVDVLYVFSEGFHTIILKIMKDKLLKIKNTYTNAYAGSCKLQPTFKRTCCYKPDCKSNDCFLINAFSRYLSKKEFCDRE